MDKEVADSISASPLQNLVPIYAGKEQQVRQRHVDRKISNPDKYIMKLPDDEIGVDGELAISGSLEDYRRNFEGFTYSIFRDLDWSNLVVAGSAALHPLLSYQYAPNTSRITIEYPLEAYYRNIAKSSDIDIFLYDLDETTALERIVYIEGIVRRAQRIMPGQGLTLRSENAITLISPKFPFRHVQIILRIYKSIAEILTGFDVDCACVAYDGKQVWTNPRGLASIVTRTNQIDLSRRSPSYENRLWKYRQHRFDTYWDALERSRIHIELDSSMPPNGLKGLARLLYSECRIQNSRSSWYQTQRSLMKVDDSGEMALTTASGYAHHNLPTGFFFTALRTQDHVYKHWTDEPYLFGDIRTVLYKGDERPLNQSSPKLQGQATFIRDDPGRQMIGSFHPLTADDWTNDAYSNKDEEGEEEEEEEEGEEEEEDEA